MVGRHVYYSQAVILGTLRDVDSFVFVWATPLLEKRVFEPTNVHTTVPRLVGT